MAAAGVPEDAFDPSIPNVARVYDYLLNGKDHFEADRAVGDRIVTALPEVQAGVQAQRAVLGRVVRYLVREDPASAGLQAQMAKGLGRVRFRTLAEVRGLFGSDLEMVPPGLVTVPEWRPDPGTPVRADYGVLQMACAGVARKL